MAKENNKQFLPNTLLGWLTAISLFIGITAGIYSVVSKPYCYFASLEKRMVGIESRMDEIKDSVNVIYNYIERKYRI